MALIASKLTSLVPFSACTLFQYDESQNLLTCRFATGTDYELMQQLTLKGGQGITGWVARNRRPLVNARPSGDLEAGGSSLPTTLQSALVCPLLLGDRVIGTLAVYHTTPSFYGDDHRRLLDRVCEQAAAVIHNAIVFEQTHEASLTDPLTNLPNTRFMVNHLGRELARAERGNAEVSLLVMDLNDFKDINDTFGHHVGDRALREIAQVLRGAIRPYDVCVRYAGDEFFVVLAGCGWDEAEYKRLELQEAVESLVFEAKPGVRMPLSISAGAAVFPHDGNTYEVLMAKADRRMYRNKVMYKRDVQARAASHPPACVRQSRCFVIHGGSPPRRNRPCRGRSSDRLHPSHVVAGVDDEHFAGDAFAGITQEESGRLCDFGRLDVTTQRRPIRIHVQDV
jgi:diguanylate cyclase (GGDEF)-like protein